MTASSKTAPLEGIALLTLDRAEASFLTAERASALADQVAEAVAREAVDIVVIQSGESGFPGSDLSSVTAVATAAALSSLCRAVESAAKPVLCILRGRIEGAGLDLALSCHYRLATESAVLAFPDIRFGLPPSGGGSQRLPRLAGAEAALDMLLSGRRLDADRAARIGLVDGVVEGDLDAATAAYAGALVSDGRGPRPSIEERRGLSEPEAFAAAIARRRAAVKAHAFAAPSRIVDCVEAALILPGEVGLDYERAAFEDLLGAPQARALRRLHLAELAASQPPAARPRPTRAVGLFGAGQMGSGIATVVLAAGIPLHLVEADDDTCASAIARIVEALDRSVARGRMTETAREDCLRRLSAGTDPTALAAADLVIEAVPERLDDKKAAFRSLDRVLRPGAIIASTTSSLDLDLLAAATSRPADVVGLHFFPPPRLMRLLEVVGGQATAPDVIATALRFARRLGKQPVRCAVSDGYIGNRMVTAWRRAADAMLEEGAAVEEIDAAMRAFGFPLGPYQSDDLAGLDAAWARRRRLSRTRDPEERYVAIADLLCEAGRLGYKSGRGYYLYRAGASEGEPDPEVARLIASERQRKGITPRAFPAAEIRDRCLLAMVAEGAQILSEGVARMAGDIDVAMVHGFAFPRWEGGPMTWADARGVTRVRDRIAALSPEDRGLWRVAPLLADLAQSGKSFAARDRDLSSE